MKKNLLICIASIACLMVQAQKVGVNKTNPSEALDVNGNVNISGTIKANGAVGTSGQVLISSGTGLTWGSLFGYKHCQMFYTAGAASWKVPAGIKEVMVEAWGGGGGYGDYVGGSSGSYARVVHAVTAGSLISYNVGSGGAYKQDGTGTTITLPSGTLTAMGGGAPFPMNGREASGFNPINPPGSMAAFYMPGNKGTVTHYEYGIKHGGIYTQTTYLSKGGAPVGMINASANEGNIVYYENSVTVWAVLNSGTPSLPSSGGCYSFSAAPGMVIFWW
ncbi:MAG: hypothetical protein V4717_09385 [Bacteroidota bacterium]